MNVDGPSCCVSVPFVGVRLINPHFPKTDVNMVLDLEANRC